MADIKNNNAAPAFGEQNKHEALILKYKNVIIGGLVAIVAGIAIGFFVKNCSTEQFNTASTDMAKAQEYFAEAIMSNDSVAFQKALKGDSINAGFLTVIENDGSGKVSNLAKLYAGICYARLGNLQEAANYLEQFDGKDVPEEFSKGVEMIAAQLKTCFEKLKVEPFCEVGDAFDPELHNAVSMVEDESLDDNTISAVYQKGYKIGDKIIRHAMVVVANA